MMRQTYYVLCDRIETERMRSEILGLKGFEVCKDPQGDQAKWQKKQNINDKLDIKRSGRGSGT